MSYERFKSVKLYNLFKYAKDALRVKEEGIYKYRSKEYNKDYILPKDSLHGYMVFTCLVTCRFGDILFIFYPTIILY